MNLIESNDLGTYFENCSFKDITTIKVGGKIRLLYYPNSIESFLTFYDYLKINGYNDYVIIGCGSNVVAGDGDYNGIVICFRKVENTVLLKTDFDSYAVISAEAGVTALSLSNFLFENSLAGGEALSSIPGTIGGLVCMNASCYDYKTSDHVIRVFAICNDELRWYKNYELDFKYRSSNVTSNNLIVLSVEMIFKKGDRKMIEDKMKKIISIRRKTQPLEYHSAGSVFKNLDNVKAWKLIEEVGLKGYRHNGAMISNCHSNFIVNDGRAKYEDVMYLVNMIKETVKERYGVDLLLEWHLFNS